MNVYSFSSSKFRFRKYYGPADWPCLSLFVYVLVGLDHEPCMCQARILLQNYTPGSWSSCALSQRCTHEPSSQALPLDYSPRRHFFLLPRQDNTGCFLTLLLICLLCFGSFWVLEITEPALAAHVCNHRTMEAKTGGSQVENLGCIMTDGLRGKKNN